MEQNKFDQQIKETLEGRSLQPSNNAWEKLSNRLDETSQNKTKTYWYIGVAASVVGILFIAVQFYNTKPIEPVIVNTPTVKQAENTQVAIEKPETTNTVLETIQPVENVESFKENSIVKVTETNVVLDKKQSILKETNAIVNTKANQEALTFEEQKIKDLVAKVEELKAQNKEVTNADIDALLLEAQKEIRFKKATNKNTGLVDANLLLEEVETDLDQSFRSKVFDAIKASFGTVKTVVAQRNN
ncbi:hypothetical protein ACFQ1R_03445 [Mariniflexile jejuense]|uniref:Uncharacterized protein n=1 Tax=Mariniflexile jejuense TaxID=1173582 RepID=A0ABW3JF77_9FLAO